MPVSAPIQCILGRSWSCCQTQTVPGLTFNPCDGSGSEMVPKVVEILKASAAASNAVKRCGGAMNLNLIRENAAKATAEDLLDRVTVYRAGMEPPALEVLEQELR